MQAKKFEIIQKLKDEKKAGKQTSRNKYGITEIDIPFVEYFAELQGDLPTSLNSAENREKWAKYKTVYAQISPGADVDAIRWGAEGVHLDIRVRADLIEAHIAWLKYLEATDKGEKNHLWALVEKNIKNYKKHGGDTFVGVPPSMPAFDTPCDTHYKVLSDWKNYKEHKKEWWKSKEEIAADLVKGIDSLKAQLGDDLSLLGLDPELMAVYQEYEKIMEAGTCFKQYREAKEEKAAHFEKMVQAAAITQDPNLLPEEIHNEFFKPEVIPQFREILNKIYDPKVSLHVAIHIKNPFLKRHYLYVGLTRCKNIAEVNQIVEWSQVEEAIRDYSNELILSFPVSKEEMKNNAAFREYKRRFPPYKYDIHANNDVVVPSERCFVTEKFYENGKGRIFQLSREQILQALMQWYIYLENPENLPRIVKTACFAELESAERQGEKLGELGLHLTSSEAFDIDKEMPVFLKNLKERLKQEALTRPPKKQPALPTIEQKREVKTSELMPTKTPEPTILDTGEVLKYLTIMEDKLEQRNTKNITQRPIDILRAISKDPCPLTGFTPKIFDQLRMLEVRLLNLELEALHAKKDAEPNQETFEIEKAIIRNERILEKVLMEVNDPLNILRKDLIWLRGSLVQAYLRHRRDFQESLSDEKNKPRFYEAVDQQITALKEGKEEAVVAALDKISHTRRYTDADYDFPFDFSSLDIIALADYASVQLAPEIREDANVREARFCLKKYKDYESEKDQAFYDKRISEKYHQAWLKAGAAVKKITLLTEYENRLLDEALDEKAAAVRYRHALIADPETVTKHRLGQIKEKFRSLSERYKTPEDILKAQKPLSVQELVEFAENKEHDTRISDDTKKELYALQALSYYHQYVRANNSEAERNTYRTQMLAAAKLAERRLHDAGLLRELSDCEPDGVLAWEYFWRAVDEQAFDESGETINREAKAFYRLERNGGIYVRAEAYLEGLSKQLPTSLNSPDDEKRLREFQNKIYSYSVGRPAMILAKLSAGSSSGTMIVTALDQLRVLEAQVYSLEIEALTLEQVHLEAAEDFVNAQIVSEKIISHQNMIVHYLLQVNDLSSLVPENISWMIKTLVDHLEREADIQVYVKAKACLRFAEKARELKKIAKTEFERLNNLREKSPKFAKLRELSKELEARKIETVLQDEKQLRNYLEKPYSISPADIVDLVECDSEKAVNPAIKERANQLSAVFKVQMNWRKMRELKAPKTPQENTAITQEEYEELHKQYLVAYKRYHREAMEEAKAIKDLSQLDPDVELQVNIIAHALHLEWSSTPFSFESFVEKALNKMRAHLTWETEAQKDLMFTRYLGWLFSLRDIIRLVEKNDEKTVLPRAMKDELYSLEARSCLHQSQRDGMLRAAQAVDDPSVLDEVILKDPSLASLKQKAEKQKLFREAKNDPNKFVTEQVKKIETWLPKRRKSNFALDEGFGRAELDNYQQFLHLSAQEIIDWIESEKIALPEATKNDLYKLQARYCRRKYFQETNAKYLEAMKKAAAMVTDQNLLDEDVRKLVQSKVSVKENKSTATATTTGENNMSIESSGKKETKKTKPVKFPEDHSIKDRMYAENAERWLNIYRRMSDEKRKTEALSAMKRDAMKVVDVHFLPVSVNEELRKMLSEEGNKYRYRRAFMADPEAFLITALPPIAALLSPVLFDVNANLIRGKKYEEYLKLPFLLSDMIKVLKELESAGEEFALADDLGDQLYILEARVNYIGYLNNQASPFRQKMLQAASAVRDKRRLDAVVLHEYELAQETQKASGSHEQVAGRREESASFTSSASHTTTNTTTEIVIASPDRRSENEAIQKNKSSSTPKEDALLAAKVVPDQFVNDELDKIEKLLPKQESKILYYGKDDKEQRLLNDAFELRLDYVSGNVPTRQNLEHGLQAYLKRPPSLQDLVKFATSKKKGGEGLILSDNTLDRLHALNARRCYRQFQFAENTETEGFYREMIAAASAVKDIGALDPEINFALVKSAKGEVLKRQYIRVAKEHPQKFVEEQLAYVTQLLPQAGEPYFFFKEARSSLTLTLDQTNRLSRYFNMPFTLSDTMELLKQKKITLSPEITTQLYLLEARSCSFDCDSEGMIVVAGLSDPEFGVKTAKMHEYEREFKLQDAEEEKACIAKIDELSAEIGRPEPNDEKEADPEASQAVAHKKRDILNLLTKVSDLSQLNSELLLWIGKHLTRLNECNAQAYVKRRECLHLAEKMPAVAEEAKKALIKKGNFIDIDEINTEDKVRTALEKFRIALKSEENLAAFWESDVLKLSPLDIVALAECPKIDGGAGLTLSARIQRQAEDLDNALRARTALRKYRSAQSESDKIRYYDEMIHYGNAVENIRLLGAELNCVLIKDAGKNVIASPDRRSGNEAIQENKMTTGEGLKEEKVTWEKYLSTKDEKTRQVYLDMLMQNDPEAFIRSRLDEIEELLPIASWYGKDFSFMPNFEIRPSTVTLIRDVVEDVRNYASVKFFVPDVLKLIKSKEEGGQGLTLSDETLDRLYILRARSLYRQWKVENCPAAKVAEVRRETRHAVMCIKDRTELDLNIEDFALRGDKDFFKREYVRCAKLAPEKFVKEQLNYVDKLLPKAGSPDALVPEQKAQLSKYQAIPFSLSETIELFERDEIKLSKNIKNRLYRLEAYRCHLMDDDAGFARAVSGMDEDERLGIMVPKDMSKAIEKQRALRAMKSAPDKHVNSELDKIEQLLPKANEPNFFSHTARVSLTKEQRQRLSGYLNLLFSVSDMIKLLEEKSIKLSPETAKRLYALEARICFLFGDKRNMILMAAKAKDARSLNPAILEASTEDASLVIQARDQDIKNAARAQAAFNQYLLENTIEDESRYFDEMIEAGMAVHDARLLGVGLNDELINAISIVENAKSERKASSSVTTTSSSSASSETHQISELKISHSAVWAIRIQKAWNKGDCTKAKKNAKRVIEIHLLSPEINKALDEEIRQKFGVEAVQKRYERAMYADPEGFISYQLNRIENLDSYKDRLSILRDIYNAVTSGLLETDEVRKKAGSVLSEKTLDRLYALLAKALYDQLLDTTNTNRKSSLHAEMIDLASKVMDATKLDPKVSKALQDARNQEKLEKQKLLEMNDSTRLSSQELLTRANTLLKTLSIQNYLQAREYLRVLKDRKPHSFTLWDKQKEKFNQEIEAASKKFNELDQARKENKKGFYIDFNKLVNDFNARKDVAVQEKLEGFEKLLKDEKSLQRYLSCPLDSPLEMILLAENKQDGAGLNLDLAIKEYALDLENAIQAHKHWRKYQQVLVDQAVERDKCQQMLAEQKIEHVKYQQMLLDQESERAKHLEPVKKAGLAVKRIYLLGSDMNAELEKGLELWRKNERYVRAIDVDPTHFLEAELSNLETRLPRIVPTEVYEGSLSQLPYPFSRILMQIPSDDKRLSADTHRRFNLLKARYCYLKSRTPGDDVYRDIIQSAMALGGIDQLDPGIQKIFDDEECITLLRSEFALHPVAQKLLEGKPLPESKGTPEKTVEVEDEREVISISDAESVEESPEFSEKKDSGVWKKVEQTADEESDWATAMHFARTMNSLSGKPTDFVAVLSMADRYMRHEAESTEAERVPPALLDVTSPLVGEVDGTQGVSAGEGLKETKDSGSREPVAGRREGEVPQTSTYGLQVFGPQTHKHRLDGGDPDPYDLPEPDVEEGATDPADKKAVSAKPTTISLKAPPKGMNLWDAAAARLKAKILGTPEPDTHVGPQADGEWSSQRNDGL